MNAPVRTFWWWSGLFWLGVVCLLGLAQSAFTLEVMTGQGGGSSVNIGLLVLAREGALLYGFGWSCMMAIAGALGSGKDGENVGRGADNVLNVLWSFGVILGTLSVLWGQGSGIPVMPFAAWVMLPMVFLAFLQVTGLVWRGRRGVRDMAMLPPMLALGLAWVGMIAGYVILADGLTEATGQFAVFGYVKQSWLIGGAMCGSAWFLRASGARGWRVWTPLALLLVYGTDAGSWYLPVAHGVWDMPGLAVILGGGVLLLVMASAFGKGSCASWRLFAFWLGCLSLWVLALGVVPENAAGFQLSPMNWHVVDATLLLCLVAPLAMVCARKWTRWCLGIGVGIFLLVFAFSASALLPGEYARGAKQTVLLDLGFVIVSVGYALAWGLILCASLGELWWAWRMKGVRRASNDVQSVDEDGRCSRMTALSLPVWVLPGVLVVVTGLAIGLLMGGGVRFPAFSSGGSSAFVSKRPGIAREGAALYAENGCGVCHTQIVRRLPDGKDLQQSVYQNGNGAGVARVSEPEDWARAGGEGLAHMGWVRLGPDLFQLGAWAEQRVRFTNQDGQGEAVARPEEWLMLHLYNPRDQRFGRASSLCPSLAKWFDVVPAQKIGVRDEALPIKSPPGTCVVPGEKIRHLVAYLRTLKRGDITRAEMLQGVEQVVPDAELHARSFVDPAYANNLPVIDTSRKEQALDALVMQKGKQLYATKCTLCHGADGRGDGINYPPLENSEWIAKDPSIMARIVRNGAEGKITVSGKTWDTTMLPPGISSPEEGAAVITYVRRRFGDAASPRIAVEQVREWWKKYGDAPFRATE